MSIARAKEQIKSFLTEKKTEKDGKVLVIKGKWGTGKTYLWQRIYESIKTDSLVLSSYSYVSLFGVDSLNELKTQIVASCKTKTNGQGRHWSCRW